MLYYKEQSQTTVEQAPVKKVIGKAPKAPRLYVNIDGTVSVLEDHLSWDLDKVNRLGE